MGTRRARAPFNLSRWFAAVSLASIAALAAVAGVSLNWFVATRMVAQEAALTREFVESLLIVEAPLRHYIESPSPALEAQMAESFEHIDRLPGVLRANIYGRDQRVIWSSNRELIGPRLGRNAELERALRGELVANREQPDADHLGKHEHQALEDGHGVFVEIYVPVLSSTGNAVIGAIEFYKRPDALSRALAQLRWYIAGGAALAGLMLHLALFGLVRRADRTIQTQQHELVGQATLAALGEMSAAVAHGIRNPLASIRSSAELIPGASVERAQESVADIIAQSDRLEAWVRELLAYTQPLDPASAAVDVKALLQGCANECARELQRRGIELRTELPRDLAAARGDRPLLAQVLRSLLANAMEALGEGGRITLRGRSAGAFGHRVAIEVCDSGPGLSRDQLARVGRPYFTTKPQGLGVGLALARRVIERCGGSMEIESAPGEGTVVRLQLAVAPASAAPWTGGHRA